MVFSLASSAVVWLAKEFREPHRQALDWLNQRTDTETEFYGVVVEVFKIDDSRPAYAFRPIAFPNEWRKANIESGADRETTEREEAYRAFFQELIDQLREHHNLTGARKGQPQSWYTFASGISGIYYAMSFAQAGRVRTEVYIDQPETSLNKSLFDALAKEKASLGTEFGEPLQWERLDNRRASRIAVYRRGTIEDDPQTLEEIREWAVNRLLRLKKVFSPRLVELLR